MYIQNFLRRGNGLYIMWKSGSIYFKAGHKRQFEVSALNYILKIISIYKLRD